MAITIPVKMNNDKKNKTESNWDLILVSSIATIIILGLWLLTYYKLKDLTETDRGTFGDMFGSVNAIFSGLALTGIIITILLQRKELKLQREELQETRKEFETQNETLKLQRFENTFFSLLNQHHQIVNAIDFRYYKKKEKDKKPLFMARSSIVNTPAEEKEIVVINGRDVFRYLYNQMSADMKNNSNNSMEIYMYHYQKAQTDFGHYFRNLYRMIKIVHETNFFYDITKATKEEIFDVKYRYTSIIRAQLSDFELLWLFYNCLSDNGIEKFKPFIEEYSLLKNIPKNLIADEKHIEKYNPKAFEP